MPSESLGHQKHHSFLNGLDKIAASPADLSLAASLISRARSDSTVIRLSPTLRTLASKKNGKQLPELVVPAYDNGNVEVTQCSSPATISSTPLTSLSPASSSGASGQIYTEWPRPYQHIPHISLGEAFEIEPLLSRLVDANAIGPRTSSICSSAFKQKEEMTLTEGTRPVSMHSQSSVQRASADPRSSASDSTTSVGKQRNQSISYEDQRCAPPRGQRSSKTLHTSHEPRRRFRLVASLKHINVKPEKGRSITQETTHTPSEEEEETRAQMASVLSLKEILQESIPVPPPLHDIEHDKIFTRECEQLLSLKPEPSRQHQLELGSPLEIADFLPPEPQTEMSQVTFPPLKHEHRASEAMSVSSSILDWDWPRPKVYRYQDGSTSPGQARPDSSLGGLAHVDDAHTALQNNDSIPDLSSMWKTTNSTQISTRLTRSPPPHRPLPPLPQEALFTSRTEFLASCEDPVLLSAEGFTQRQDQVQTPMEIATSMSKQKSRLATLAEGKGLQLDSNVLRYNMHGDCQLVKSLVPSPLGLRFSNNGRSARVDSLKRRHLSVDKHITLPPVPTGRSHRRQGSSTSSVVKHISSKSRLPKGSPKLRRTNIAHSHVTNQSVASPLSCLDHVVLAEDEPKTSAKSMSSSSASQSGKAQRTLQLPRPRSPYKGHSRGHSRGSSSESQPSKARSARSSTRSRDTDLTTPCLSSDHSSFEAHPGRRLTMYDDKPNAKKVLPKPTLVAAIEAHPGTKLSHLKAVEPRNIKVSGDSATFEAHPGKKIPVPSPVGDWQKDFNDFLTVDSLKPPVNTKDSTTAKLDQIKQMTRVYRSMLDAHDHLEPKGPHPKPFPELRQPDCLFRVDEKSQQSQGKRYTLSSRTQDTLVKIEADLATYTPKKEAKNSDFSSIRTVIPRSSGSSSSSKPIPMSKICVKRNGKMASSNDEQTADQSGSPLSSIRIKNGGVKRSPFSSACNELPVKAGSTLIGRSRGAALKQQSSDKKRYSLISMYNPCSYSHGPSAIHGSTARSSRPFTKTQAQQHFWPLKRQVALGPDMLT